MRQQITGEKLGRLDYLFQNQSNAKLLSDALITKSTTGATLTNVKDVSPTHYEYRLKLPADSTEGWLKKRGLRISKEFIEAHNAAAQEAWDEAEANEENPPPLDFDSNATRIQQVTDWIKAGFAKSNLPIDVDNDKVEIIALSGKVDEANLLVEIQEAGLIADHGKKRQQRIKLPRLDIATVTGGSTLTVTELNHHLIRTQLLETLSEDLPEVVEGDEVLVPRLFLEDILIQNTHYKVGGVYTAVISNIALDYYGEFEFMVVELG